MILLSQPPQYLDGRHVSSRLTNKYFSNRWMGEPWEHLERKRHSRVGSNAERGSDKGSSVGMAMCHIQSARGQSIGANVTRRVESNEDRC